MVCIANVILRRPSLVKALFLGIAGLLTVSSGVASDTPDMPLTVPSVPSEALTPPAACASGRYRDFDFWLGAWEVRLADGTLAGENLVQVSGDGCFITERWQGVRGSTGFSLNFFDPAAGRWRQIWVSAGSIIEISGTRQAGSMVLEGEIRYLQAHSAASGTSDTASVGPIRRFRGRWTPLPDGRVRQFFEELIPADAGEEKWQPWFEGFYVKAVE